MQSDNPTAAILVIGDEILSGRTREGNAHHLSQVLNSIGIDLREVAEAYPDLSMGSYPFQAGQRYGTNLVIRGLDGQRVSDAMTALRARLAL